MKTMVTLTHEEAQSYLAYALICETMEGAFWNSGRRLNGEVLVVHSTHTNKKGAVNVEFKTPGKSGQKSASLKKLKIVKAADSMHSAWEKIS